MKILKSNLTWSKLWTILILNFFIQIIWNLIANRLKIPFLKLGVTVNLKVKIPLF